MINQEDLRVNNLVIQHMEKLTNLYIKLGENFKSGTFKKVAEAIKNLEERVGPMSFKQVKGIGQSSVNEVKEVLEHIEAGNEPTSARLKELEAKLENKMADRSIKSLATFISLKLNKPAAVILLKLSKISTNVDTLIKKANAGEISEEDLANAIKEF